MRVDPAEAEVVLRIFREAADGVPFTRIAKRLNADHIPGRVRSAGGWTVGSVRRTLENTKYRGHWVWNKRGNRRDRRTGRRRYVDKPESEWVVQDDEALRIVPQALWDRVAGRLHEIRKVWPGGKARFRSWAAVARACLPAVPPLRSDGLRLLRPCHRAGQRPPGRLLRLFRRCPACVQQSCPRAAPGRGEGHPGRPSGSSSPTRARVPGPRSCARRGHGSVRARPGHAEAEGGATR